MILIPSPPYSRFFPSPPCLRLFPSPPYSGERVRVRGLHRVACVVAPPPLRCGFPSVNVLIRDSRSFTVASSPHDLATSMADLMVLIASPQLPVSAWAAASVSR